MEPYADIAYATAYFTTRLHTEEWTCASLPDREAALVMATRDIDQLDYVGCKSDPNQVREFPRDSQVDVPDDIKIACCEIALARLEGVDPDAEIEASRMSSQSVESIRTSYVPNSISTHIMAGISSATAWRYLLRYLRDRKKFSICRVS